MSTATGTSKQAERSLPSSAQVVWSRRWQSFRDGWRQFTKNPAGVAGLVILAVVSLLAILAPVIAPAEMLVITNVESAPFQPPSLEHPFGTDHSGKELWARMVWGARVSLIVGIAATLMSMIIGTLVGLMAGYFGGWFGGLLMRIIDFFLVLPSLILAIVLSSVLSRGMLTIIIALGVTSWAGTARVVRSQTLSVSSREYVDRARALGAGHFHIIFKHLLPAVIPLVLANTTLTVGGAIIAESTLAFLGLGDPTQESWGAILRNAMDYSAATSGYWWYVLIPGIAIVLVVMAFTLIGRALETVVNPTLRSR